VIIALEGNSESCYASTEYMCDKSEAKHMDMIVREFEAIPESEADLQLRCNLLKLIS
jgi:hypothetical protein